MIRAAQCDQNVILRVSVRNQPKKCSERASSEQFFIERFNKKLLKSIPSRCFFFFCRFLADTLKITF
ncbi:hypothetical protein RHMOL_Rhmol03G0132000 [Rhododendron molle]|uniref:Uncharacterized protein n=1 Tax=Rhododendron molle TaxID=49168 RepID=A0ACC0PDG2_RHOML|nr:hypothetical protein RHMOL_Rhmol03G0132000 [Rhododendron molle]